MEMIMLHDHFMYFAARRAFFVFPVFEAHLADVLTAASDFNAYNAAVIKNINAVIGGISLGGMVHNGITHLLNFLGDPNITLEITCDNPKPAKI